MTFTVRIVQRGQDLIEMKGVTRIEIVHDWLEVENDDKVESVVTGTIVHVDVFRSFE